MDFWCYFNFANDQHNVIDPDNVIGCSLQPICYIGRNNHAFAFVMF